MVTICKGCPMQKYHSKYNENDNLFSETDNLFRLV